ncbi:ice-binding family protein [Prosthecobacter sp.]|uniref:ice-binding family protein n=1 Tax=Prosthecobacter sp. TaxID=1965333 RepID=UPI002489DE9C|nr:ice-binding family protein [Prosthecobacter sp.]MDI1311450.1 ice-binding family protein [Prosthecobacter sp.]
MSHHATGLLLQRVRNHALILIAGAAGLLPCLKTHAQIAVDLGAAAPFSVLAGAGITVAASGTSTIEGDIGSYPTLSITGLENVILGGINHAGDSTTQSAKESLLTAYNAAAAQIAPAPSVGIFDLAGATLTSGVYRADVAYELNGSLILDGGGDSNSVWIFQSDTTLTTGSGSQISLINGAQASHIFWQIGSSATLGTNSVFAGSILALESITATDGAQIDGGLYALNGAVTLDNNQISVVPEPGSALLLGYGVALLVSKRRRKARPVRSLSTAI